MLQDQREPINRIVHDDDSSIQNRVIQRFLKYHCLIVWLFDVFLYCPHGIAITILFWNANTIRLYPIKQTNVEGKLRK